MHRVTRKLRTFGPASLTILVLACFGVSSSSPSEASGSHRRIAGPPGGLDCSDGAYQKHWARTWSGASSTDVGTRIDSRTPSQWSVESPYGTTAENVWIMNASNSQDSAEAGYYSGLWAYGNGGWSSSLVSYMTDSGGYGSAWNNINGLQWGANQDFTITVYQNSSLQPVSTFRNLATGASARFVDTQYPGGVSEPISNYAQGEVHYDSTWMGGGSGELITGSWTNDKSGGTWYLWGSNAGCSTNSGYFVTSGGDSYSNGGYSAK